MPDPKKPWKKKKRVVITPAWQISARYRIAADMAQRLVKKRVEVNNLQLDSFGPIFDPMHSSEFSDFFSNSDGFGALENHWRQSGGSPEESGTEMTPPDLWEQVTFQG